MCFFGGAQAAPAPKKPEFEDAPPVVTGEQTGVDKPKNTAKATEKLRMMRKKKETSGNSTVNTNLNRTTSLLTRNTKDAATARMNNKSTYG